MYYCDLHSVWDVSSGQMLNTLVHHCEAVLHLRFSDATMVTCSKVGGPKLLSHSIYTVLVRYIYSSSDHIHHPTHLL